MRNENENLGKEEILSRLAAECPAAFERAEVVGAWVWVSFPTRPAPEVRAKLQELGFYWNRRRAAWQHHGGVFRKRAPGTDPRARYGAYRAAEAFAPAGVAESGSDEGLFV